MARFSAEAGVGSAHRAPFNEGDLLLLSRSSSLHTHPSLPVQAADPNPPPSSSASPKSHVLAMLHRREFERQSRTLVLHLRFHLPASSSSSLSLSPSHFPRLTRVQQQLTGRSTWHATRLISLVPHMREFQALAALPSLPPTLLHRLLSPRSHALTGTAPHSHAHTATVLPSAAVVEREKAVTDLAKVLPAEVSARLAVDFNDGQLAAIHSVVLGGGEDGSGGAEEGLHRLVLVQGPPGE